jgi:hypothetical protein
MKQMMPVRPPPFAQQACRLIAWLNIAAWQIAFHLPRMKTLTQELQDFCLALQIMRIGGTVMP